MVRACLIPLLFLAGPTLAQPQYSNWYFGFGAGVSFAGGAPAALSGGPISTDEGCAAISDGAGQLLFSTNGVTVYDRLGHAMPNGSGLAGDPSSAQSALIMPFVSDAERYYVFTVPAQLATWSGGYNGLACSVVNMALNGGLGDVEVLNTHLADHTTEHLTATRHANGRDAWVVCHGWDSDVYHVFLVDCHGLHGPYDSHAGGHIGPDPADTQMAAIGCMDISGQGDRLATTWTNYDPDQGGSAHLDVLSFNNATGQVGAGTHVTHFGNGANDFRGYGVAFSPNGSRLYWSEYGLLSGVGYCGLLQYDLTAPDLAASEQTIATANDAFGTLQLGPDGRLYAARLNGSTFLSCLTAPDALGAACGFVAAAVDLSPAQSTWGLANDWDTFPVVPPLEPLVLNDTTVCTGVPLEVDATYARPFETPTYVWSTGESTPVITVTEPGSYTVRVELSCDTLTAGLTVSFGGLSADLGPDRLLCLGDSLALTAPSWTPHRFWSTGDTTMTTTVQDEGPVWLLVRDAEGCEATDTVLVDVTDCTCPVYVPDAFTPNADDINDGFTARSDCDFRAFKLTVYDRWGHALFTSDDPQRTWSGGGVPNGIYTWVLDYAWTDGRQDHNATKRGSIALVR